MEEDELISSDDEDVPVRVIAALFAFLSWTWTLQQQLTGSAQAKQLATTERKEKNKKRKVAEGQLQIKRQEMDKAKVSYLVPFCFSVPYHL